jgi:two-component system, chemotaxis family, sensor kinase CheA
MSIDLSQFHAAFFDEALESLDQAEEALLLVEKLGLDRERINIAFRAVHSLKGSAATLGFQAMAEFAHELEAVFEAYRRLLAQNAAVKSTPNSLGDKAMSLILSGLDLLRTHVLNAQRKQGEVAPGRAAALTDQLIGLQEGLAHQLQVRVKVALHYQVHFKPFPDMLSNGHDPLRYLDALANLGELQTHAILGDTADPCRLSWRIELVSTSTTEDIAELFSWVEGLCELTITTLAAPEDINPTINPTLGRPANLFETLDAELQSPLPDDPAANASSAPSQGSGEARHQRSIQVPSQRIDTLLAQLGDLAVAQAELESRVSTQEADDLFQRLSRQTRQLQDSILAMRMSPVSTLFKRFERVIRDAELELGKKVQLTLSGENHELDSSMIERLVDPVTHLIRNAIDHGIESADERQLQGKPRLASLHLSAEQRIARFVLTIQDDGCGLNVQAIREKAIEQGLATPSDQKSDAQWVELIFCAGFSTAKQVNHWSGRGVGLDAVVSALKAMGGELSVTSVTGKGTRFSIHLPLTLALTDALIVESQGEHYAIALSAVSECLQGKPSLLQTLPNDQQLYRLRQNTLPFSSLAHLMGLSEAIHPQQNFSAVVISDESEACVIQVGKIIGQRQIVIKSIQKNIGPVRHCQSAAVLGEGKVIFVLDPGSLLRHSGLTHPITA